MTEFFFLQSDPQNCDNNVSYMYFKSNLIFKYFVVSQFELEIEKNIFRTFPCWRIQIVTACSSKSE